MKKIVILQTLLILLSTSLFGWGGKGHAIVTSIAEQNLNRKAAKKVAQLLDNHSMVYYASWMDNLRGDSRYDFSTTWHYINVDEGYTYETMPKNPSGDVYTATVDIIDKLKKGGLSDSLERMYFKFLIHTVADMHCPMHAGHKVDLGGNRTYVKWFRQPTSLHSLWDSKLIESARPWSYLEWRDNLDILTRRQKRKMDMGTIDQWLNECLAAATEVYKHTKPEQNYSYDYIKQFSPLLEDQLYKGGLRLAYIINDIYGR